MVRTHARTHTQTHTHSHTHTAGSVPGAQADGDTVMQNASVPAPPPAGRSMCLFRLRTWHAPVLAMQVACGTP